MFWLFVFRYLFVKQILQYAGRKSCLNSASLCAGLGSALGLVGVAACPYHVCVDGHLAIAFLFFGLGKL
jgi:hypothetical protein